MNMFLFAVSLLGVIGVVITHSALRPQDDDGETSNYGGSLHERLSRIEAIMHSDDILRKRLGALEEEIKRVGYENMFLRDAMKKQDSTLKELTIEIKKLQSDNIKLERFCKESFMDIRLTEKEENQKPAFVQKHPKTNNMTQDNWQMVKINAGRIEGKYDNVSQKSLDTETGNDLENTGFIPQRHIRQEEVGQYAFFSTVSTPELTNLGLHHTIVFDNVITNIGRAYHSNTGIFITPVDGVYIFNLRGTSSPRKAEALELVKNGSGIQSIYPDAITIGSYTSDSLAAVVELHKGDEVWVRTNGGSGEIHGRGLTCFSGWLLFMK
ncbi:hypothetical protein CHS0354_012780 [Potamilus streckersoni]|uniref:C1q domain-containing protein n=1 Tax=Potamilus streckersoni TaxID=2493646 RepID=A0AAE0RV68_9BIVA|nr:hypothetical protein CHS0354_012780 [Potamilus streckersoni]